MGDPRKPRKKWEGPTHPWKADILREELELVGKYGLRNKRELWTAKTILRRIRARARSLLGLSEEERMKAEKSLARRLYYMGLVPSEDVTVDTILNLTVEDVLERRLQTMVFKKGLASSIYHARQLITHGHIALGGRRVTSPGHLVTREEEELIDFYPLSPFAKKETSQKSE